MGFYRFWSQRWSNFCGNCWGRLFHVCCGEKELKPRNVHFGRGQRRPEKHPRNVVRNQ